MRWTTPTPTYVTFSLFGLNLSQPIPALAKRWSWERSTVGQSTEFGGQGISLWCRAMDLSSVYCWFVTLDHFASVSILTLVILQHTFVEISATASKLEFLVCCSTKSKEQQQSTKEAMPWTKNEKLPTHRSMEMAQEPDAPALPPGKHQGSAAKVHIPQIVVYWELPHHMPCAPWLLSSGNHELMIYNIFSAPLVSRFN